MEVGSVLLSTLLDVDGDGDGDESVMMLLLSARCLFKLIASDDKDRLCYGTVSECVVRW